MFITNHKNGHDPQWLILSNEGIFLDLTWSTDTISYVSEPGDAYFEAKSHKTQVNTNYKKTPEPPPLDGLERFRLG